MQDKKKYTAVIIVILLTVIAVIYVAFAAFFQKHFCFGTSIDGISVGGYGIEQVEKMLRQEAETYSLQLVLREGETEEISGSSISLTPVFQGEIDELLEEQNGFSWVLTWIQKNNLQLEQAFAYDEELLKQEIEQLSCMKEEKQRKPVNAGVSEYSQENGFTVVPADYGTTIDEQALVEAVSHAVEVLSGELVLEDAGCYQNPEILDEDAQLLACIEQLNRYVGTVIEYDFGEQTEVLDAATIHTWLSENDRTPVIDEEAVEEYVKELGKKYNTAYQPKEFATSYGTTVTISNGFYGWRINRDEEVAQIMTDLETGETVKREPVYSQRANSHGEHDYGNSYVEINLTAQHLFVYQDGALVVESDFVSGNVSNGHATPVGAFGLTYKTTDAVLRGQDYETPVKYWMPFNGDVGMHDATWRSKFGGNIYKTNGSHGCINLPSSVAEKIYQIVDQGYAVLVYELPGTESKTVQQQDATTVVNMINAIGTVTLESETAISSARNLYDALSDSAKAYVTNYDVLVAAEASLAALKGGIQPEQSQEDGTIVQPEQPQDAGTAETSEQPQDTGTAETSEQPQDAGTAEPSE